MTTGERIKSLRTAMGMSQTELGDKIGVKTPAIYKYENGLIVNLKRSTIEKLANALETTPSFLMGFDDEKEPPTVSDEELNEVTSIFARLSPDNRAKLIELSRLYLDAQNKNGESK